MDLKLFYQKIRGVEASIACDPAVVVSNETADGGKAGVRTEVTREQAARLIVEGRARLASEPEASEFRKQLREAQERVEQEAKAKNVQLTVIPEQELQRLKAGVRPPKG